MQNKVMKVNVFSAKPLDAMLIEANAHAVIKVLLYPKCVPKYANRGASKYWMTPIISPLSDKREVEVWKCSAKGPRMTLKP